VNGCRRRQAFRLAAVGLLALSATSFLAAQGRRARGLYPVEVLPEAVFSKPGVGEPSQWDLVVSRSGVLHTVGPDLETFSAAELALLQAHPDFSSVDVDTRSAIRRSIQTGVTEPGDYAAIGGSLQLLVCGSGSSGGRLEFWSIGGGGALSPQAGMDYPAADWTGVAFDASQSTIYLLDAAGGAIYQGAWIPGASLPAAAQLTVYATQSELSGLVGAGDGYLRFVEEGNGTLAVGGGGKLFLGHSAMRAAGGVFLSRSGGLLASVSGRWWSPAGAGSPVPVATSAAEHGTSLEVLGDAGELVVLTNLAAGGVIGSGFVSSTTNSVVLSLSAPLVLGDVYEASYPAHPSRSTGTFECVARYGIPEVTLDGLAFEKRIAELDAFVGNDDFSIKVRLRMEPPPASPTVLVGVYMLGNFRDANGVDPIIVDPVDGDGLVVVPINILDTYGFVGPDGMGYMMQSMVIPNTPTLVGEVLLTQFAALDSQGLKFSEVIGQELREDQ
jgi:hypothetical protein